MDANRSAAQSTWARCASLACFAWLGLCILGQILCTPFSAPTPFGFHEGPTTVAPGHVRLAVTGGGGTGSIGIPGGVAGGHLQARLGVAPDHELGVASDLLYVNLKKRPEPGFPDVPNELAVAAKLDYKWRFHPNFAFLAGAGGGLTPLGSFWGGDIGLVGGGTGPGLQPYGGARMGVSVPWHERGLVTHAGKEDGVTDPIATTYLMGAGGFLYPLIASINITLEVGAGIIFSKPESGFAAYGSFGFVFLL